jgi:hypothetical protein
VQSLSLEQPTAWHMPPDPQTVPLNGPSALTAPDGLQSWSTVHCMEHAPLLHCARTSARRVAHSLLAVHPGVGVHSFVAPSQP